MTIRFTYNGKVRTVKVEKARADYVQGFNLEAGDRPAATYSIAKMSDVSVVDGNDAWIESMLTSVLS